MKSTSVAPAAASRPKVKTIFVKIMSTKEISVEINNRNKRVERKLHSSEEYDVWRETAHRWRGISSIEHCSRRELVFVFFPSSVHSTCGLLFSRVESAYQLLPRDVSSTFRAGRNGKSFTTSLKVIYGRPNITWWLQQWKKQNSSAFHPNGTLLSSLIGL